MKNMPYLVFTAFDLWVCKIITHIYATLISHFHDLHGFAGGQKRFEAHL